MQQFLSRLFSVLMKNRTWVFLCSMAVLIKLAALYPLWIEQYYTYGFYPYISGAQRFLFGWIPFSVGDLFYGFLLVVVIVKTVQLGKAIFRRRINRQYLAAGLKQFAFFFLFVYVWFNLLWGLNYDRVGIAGQLQLSMTKYSLVELDSLTSVLQERLNYYAPLADSGQRVTFYKKRNLFREAVTAYRVASGRYAFLQYRPASIKPSLYSYAGNILGFQGYYNPFSGEAQVNTTVPVFMQPYVACHEIGHQVGYAKENEANFSGFLACRVHPSPVFRYSVYFDMYNYAISELYRKDSVTARTFLENLHPQVKKDYAELNRFFDKYANPLEPVITWFYGNYLKANNQPAGKQTYNQVVAFLIAYQRKFGKESL